MDRVGEQFDVVLGQPRWTKSVVMGPVFEELQQSQVVRIKIEAVSLDSTNIKVHPDGTPHTKKTACMNVSLRDQYWPTGIGRQRLAVS